MPQALSRILAPSWPTASPELRVCPWPNISSASENAPMRPWATTIVLHIAILILAWVAVDALRPPVLLSNPLLSVPVIFTVPAAPSENMAAQTAPMTPPQATAPMQTKSAPVKTAPALPADALATAQPQRVDSPKRENTAVDAPPAPANATTAASPAAPGSAGEFRGLPLDKAVDYATPPMPPAYPPAAIANNEQGEVMLRVLIDAQGTVTELIVHQSSGFQRLDRAAQMAVREWRFIPARAGLLPRPAWVEVPVRFELR